MSTCRVCDVSYRLGLSVILSPLYACFESKDLWRLHLEPHNSEQAARDRGAARHVQRGRSVVRRTLGPSLLAPVRFLMGLSQPVSKQRETHFGGRWGRGGEREGSQPIDDDALHHFAARPLATHRELL